MSVEVYKGKPVRSCQRVIMVSNPFVVGRNEYRGRRCSRYVNFIIDGVTYCKQHAGAELLRRELEGSA